MEIKDIIIFAVIIIIVAFVASFILSPSADAKYTSLEILNKGDFGENSTLYVKLADNDKTALSDKTLHVKILNKKGKTVYDKNVKTHATGVGLAKLENLTPGEYTVNVTFDGDGNYSGSSISQKIKVKGGEVEDVVDNSTLINETIQDAIDSGDTDAQTYTPQQQQQSYSQSYTPSQQQQQSSQSSDSGSSDTYIDENGNEMLPEYDEDGKEIDPTK